MSDGANDAPIARLRQRYERGEAEPVAELNACLARANSNAGHNVYLAQDAAWSRAEAAKLDPARRAAQPLWGVPVSLKDCFDLEGFATTCGSTFYGQAHGIAKSDSAVAARLRAAGAVLTGKTHLHQLAYGITGQNRDFGDCLQPRDATLLTGGSSSGAAASVQEGSALAAIGTDTGGSVRAPAALCGLSGYRSSIALNTPLRWQGGAHLAPTFDTLGWLYRDLRDGPLLGHALLDLPMTPAPKLEGLRVGVPSDGFLHDCEPEVMATLREMESLLRARGARVEVLDTEYWEHCYDLFAPIQASEAAAIHHGNFEHFELAIAERLAWGASISAEELAALRGRLKVFRAQSNALFDRFDSLLLPCAPVARLVSTVDQSEARMRILRYTAPVSLAGLPVVTIAGAAGGLQLVGAMGSDATLLALSAALGLAAR
jgi:Asp-tRNA(Asn)/Glu-tRNA(Gln) amidotransferase A subunit family amidase